MIATYRIQLQPDFGFAEVETLLPYLARLGVSHLYLSPITEAAGGSLHGYDVVDHNQIRADFGGREAFDHLLDAVQQHGLKLILDWVPNHSGVGPWNAYWQDVLAYGPHSPYARYFDIDWNPLKPELQGKVLLPFLGRPYGEVLDDGEITITYEDGRFYASYFENRYTLSPTSYGLLLESALAHHERTEPYWDLKNLRDAYRTLRPEERDKAEALRLRLAALAERVSPEPWLNLSREQVHELLEEQHWRLSFWKTAGYEINYRRFFDINGLVGLRMEDDHVFWDAHRLLGELLAHPAIEGVRIDHVDGLFDPHQYLQRLRELGAKHVWVEKILAHGETLPQAWPVAGTTGYQFMNDVMHVLLQPEGYQPLERTYRRLVPESRPYERILYRSKTLVMETMLSSELFRLAYELDRLSEADYHTRDFTLEGLREALAAIVAAFRRYRTYLPYDTEGAREVIQEVVYRARSNNPATETTVYDFIARVILGEVHETLREQQRAWVGRFQQYTAPVAAKGVEDTTFYRHLRLTALSEVGGEPDDFTMERQAFHAHARFRAHRYPQNLITTATHDHKRGADTRMRLIALAEVPELWEETVAALAELGEPHAGLHGPAAHDRFLLFQTLAALWAPPPSEEDAERFREALADRLVQYTQKASREAKLHTSWIAPNEDYETDLEAFVRGVCTDPGLDAVIGTLAETLARLGFSNTLSQALLHLTSPGVPDLYQGTELLDLSLVDPDNRRPVDYALRERLLDDLASLLETPDAETVRTFVEAHDARTKFYFVARLLRLRQQHPALFSGEYLALDVEGDGAESWLAYARIAEAPEEDALIVLVPRFPATRTEAGSATIALPEAWAEWDWTEGLTNTPIPPASALDVSTLPLPWAVLKRTR